MINRSKVLVVLLGSVALHGCGSLPPPEMPGETMPRHVALLTPGVEIRADSGAWALTGSRPTQPPFRSEGPFAVVGSPLNHFDQALAQGAQLVRVQVPQLEEPLYGVLSLNGVYETTTDTSAKRVYRLQIPEKHVHAARGGQVSVVYQPYDFTHQVVLENESGTEYYGDVETTGASWVLWLSDAPFPGQSETPASPPANPAPQPER